MPSPAAGTSDDGAVTTQLTAIVVAAYNAERWIAETLASVQHQAAEHWVCLVVDDGSSDATAAVVRGLAAEDTRIRLLSRGNGGVSAARNTGLAQLPADAVTVAFVDADDLWHPDALGSLRATLDGRPDAVGVTALARHVDEAGLPVNEGAHEARLRGRPTVVRKRIGLLPASADTDFASLAIAGRIWPPAVGLFRADVVRRAGGFDTTLVIGEDWDLYLRLARSGPFAFLDRVLVDYRQHPTSATVASRERLVVDLDRIRRKAWEDGANTPGQRASVVRGWRAVETEASRTTVGRLAWALRNADRAQALDAARCLRALVPPLARRHPPAASSRSARSRMPMVDAVRKRVTALQRG